MKYEKIGDLCDSYKVTVKPKNNVTYALFSFPAFDLNKTPELAIGNAIKSNKFAVDNYSILFNKLNVHSKRVWNIGRLTSQNNICSTEFIPLHAKDCIDQDYLYYCLVSDEVTNDMNTSQNGTSNSHQRINEEILFAHEIPVPTMGIQKRIASILRNLDDKINLNNAINENLAA